jgi:Uncharacterised nucleotidyltransferase
MDFKRVTEKLLASFKDRYIRYALIGGFAVGLWGAARGTVDMDFIVLREDLEALDEIMSSLGYELRYRSENISQFIASDALFGEIDFLHAFREPSLRMLGHAVEKSIFGGEFAIRVLRPEDLIGLKVQAMANNAERETADLSDIEALMRLYGTVLDWGLLKEYFALFEREELFYRLNGKYHEVQ